MSTNFAIERTREFEKLRKSPPGYDALKILERIREEYDCSIEGYMNSLAILSDTTYEDRKHFLLELIQNADDADYGDKIPEITFTITDDGLELFYNEIGFSLEDIISLTDTGSSTKKSGKNNSTSFIGEKGIGFKSVFALAESVEIQSGPWHFQLRKDMCVVPRPIKGEQVLLTGTRQKIKFIDPHITYDIYLELKRYVDGEVESFLYLQKIKKFILINQRGKQHERFEIEILADSQSPDKLTLRTINTGEERHFMLYSETLTFSKELVAARWEKIGTSMGDVDRKVTLAALIGGNRYERSGRLFCFLPTSVKLPIPVFMQIDGVTKADRERLHDPQNNQWNRYLLEKLPEIIARAITTWAKKMDSPDEFQRFILVDPGDDQLRQVFESAKTSLEKQSWVKVMGDEILWKSPEEVIRLPQYLLDLLSAYPHLRTPVERLFNKFILDPSWENNMDLIHKLSRYKINILGALDMLRALQCIEFPEEVLCSEPSLVVLYGFLTEIASSKYNIHRHSSEQMTEAIMKRIFDLKVFPLNHLGFSKIEDPQNIFYISQDSLKTSSFAAQINLIDPAYTIPQPETTEDSGTNSSKTTLAETLIKLLSLLGVKELNRQSIISEFIIPELKSTDPIPYPERMEKLFILYRHYVESRKTHRDPTKYLHDAKKICLYDLEMNLIPVEQLILPPSVRISSEENVYDPYNPNLLYLSEEWLLQIDQEKTLFHDFLLDLGIKHRPEFISVQESYKNPEDFTVQDPQRSSIWKKRIQNDYSISNRVTVDRVILHPLDVKILNSQRISPEYERLLYGEWKKSYIGNEINDHTLSYFGQAIPGYFLVSYQRKDKRTVQIDDIDWGGVPSSQIPILTLGGDLLPTTKVFTFPQLKEKYFPLLELLPGVLAEDKKSNHYSYDKCYLQSLGIPRMEITDTEVLWQKTEKTKYEDILCLIIELIKLDVPFSGLRIMDKSTFELRAISDFKMGQVSMDESPLIELQYGEFGTILGTLCGLPKEGSIEIYRNTISEILASTVLTEKQSRKLVMLLQDWNSFSPEDQIQIINDFKAVVKDAEPPFLTINDTDLADTLVKQKKKCIHLHCDLSTPDLESVKKAATSIGFTLPDSSGQLLVKNMQPILSDTLQRCHQIMKHYTELLEKKEVTRLDSKLKAFGGISQIFHRVFFANSITRQIAANIEYPLELPYQDDLEKRILIPTSTGCYEIIQIILLLIEFAPRRNIENDLLSIRKTAEKQELDARRSHHTEEIHNFTTPKYDSQNSTYESSPIRPKQHSIQNIEEQSTSRDFYESNSSVGNTASEAMKEVIVSKDVRQIIQNLGKITREDNISKAEVLQGWKIGIHPDEEASIRTHLVDQIARSLANGPEVYKKKLRKTLASKKMYNGKILLDNELLIDKDAINPKAFLENEYDCRCQICGTQLIFDSGKKWVNVYYFQEKKDGAWFYERPFNFLGLCPNCHTLAKHGESKDFSHLIEEAKNVINGDTFAEAVPEFYGDYYLVDVVLDNQHYAMKVSKLHMSYFVALVISDTHEDIEDSPAHDGFSHRN